MRLFRNPKGTVVAIVVFVAAQWRHSSSAGSCRPNVGRDLLAVGWTF